MLNETDKSTVTEVATPAKPRWERPEVSVLDIESGTLTTVGNFSDGGGGSTS